MCDNHVHKFIRSVCISIYIYIYYIFIYIYIQTCLLCGHPYGPISHLFLCTACTYLKQAQTMTCIDIYYLYLCRPLNVCFSGHYPWYRLQDIGSTQYLCCMNPTAGSFTVNERLQRHFWTCSVQFPEQSALNEAWAL